MRVLSDPTSIRRVTPQAGWGTSSKKTTGPAIAAAELVAMSCSSRTTTTVTISTTPVASLLPSADVVVTTTLTASRLGVPARGLDAWASTQVEATDKPTLTITATPCRHGPPLSRPIVGHVVGFALEWEGQTGGVLWISGDTVLYDGVRQVAERLDVDIAILHLGEVQFPMGPIRQHDGGERRRAVRCSSPVAYLCITRLVVRRARDDRRDSDGAPTISNNGSV
jgi:hypothetical protein